jgi:hypothetical protein
MDDLFAKFATQRNLRPANLANQFKFEVMDWMFKQNQFEEQKQLIQIKEESEAKVETSVEQIEKP